MKLVVGLGNPGPEYADHRHNIGAVVARRVLGARVLLPTTFMNVSGTPVASAAHYFRVAVEDVLVIHDELDLPFGEVRLKQGGGTAGHNGLKSITAAIGPDYARVRVGIGRPPPGVAVADFVLSPFNIYERSVLDVVVAKALKLVTNWLA